MIHLVGDRDVRGAGLRGIQPQQRGRHSVIVGIPLRPRFLQDERHAVRETEPDAQTSDRDALACLKTTQAADSGKIPESTACH